MKQKTGQEKDLVSRSWMLTLKASDYPQQEVEEKLAQYSYIGQLEKGEETGYEHWQVYVENKTQIRFSTLKSKFPTGHFEVRRGSKESCYDYVTKDDTALGVRIQNGEIDVKEKKRGRAEELDRLRTLLLGGKPLGEIILEEQSSANHLTYLRELDYQMKRRQAKGKLRDVEVSYIFGATGVGKTRMVYDLYADRPEELNVVGNYAHPFDSYDAEECLVLDEFAGQLDFEYLLKLLDRYPIELRARYRDKTAVFTKVFILSNVPLSHCYPDVMKMRPRQWDALLRRIDHYQEMQADGVLVDVPKTVHPVLASRTEPQAHS